MSYIVKEILWTLQGEGFNTGTPAVFLRFTGCNLWTGREQHRHLATCKFCDTDFIGINGPGGGRFPAAADLAEAVAATWGIAERSYRFVVCTGGEPLLQLDDQAVEALHREDFRVAVETNGTVNPPRGLDWVTVSPKAGADLVICHGDELKLVFPQTGLHPDDVKDLDFKHFFLQPMDGDQRAENTVAAVDYCLAHPRWRLSLQTHKYIGIP